MSSQADAHNWPLIDMGEKPFWSAHRAGPGFCSWTSGLGWLWHLLYSSSTLRIERKLFYCAIQKLLVVFFLINNCYVNIQKRRGRMMSNDDSDIASAASVYRCVKLYTSSEITQRQITPMDCWDLSIITAVAPLLLLLKLLIIPIISTFDI